MNKLVLGICQMMVCDDKKKNLEKARNLIIQAKESGANLIVLPEIFNSPYSNDYFPIFAEEYPYGDTIKFLSSIAKEQNIFLVGGSIPEKHEEKIYNTSFVFDNNGVLLGKHRKVHLFDIDIKDGIKFKESDTLTPGDELTIIDIPFCKIGIAICYDIRFPELFRLMSLKGAEVIIVPAAFNMTTGPAHWDLTLRARALDNQVFVAAASPARDVNASYVAYGHSSVISPWGDIINQLDEKEGILIQEIDLNKVQEIRAQLPLLKHRRTEIY